MTPDQEERMVKAYEAIAVALTKLANPLVQIAPAQIGPAIGAAVDLKDMAGGTLSVTGDVTATGMSGVTVTPSDATKGEATS